MDEMMPAISGGRLLFVAAPHGARSTTTPALILASPNGRWRQLPSGPRGQRYIDDKPGLGPANDTFPASLALDGQRVAVVWHYTHPDTKTCPLTESGYADGYQLRLTTFRGTRASTRTLATRCTGGGVPVFTSPSFSGASMYDLENELGGANSEAVIRYDSQGHISGRADIPSADAVAFAQDGAISYLAHIRPESAGTLAPPEDEIIMGQLTFRSGL